jgi:hypothetical protein
MPTIAAGASITALDTRLTTAETTIAANITPPAPITQAAHGFVKGQGVYPKKNGAVVTWYGADSSDPSTIGLAEIMTVVDANNFVINGRSLTLTRLQWDGLTSTSADRQATEPGGVGTGYGLVRAEHYYFADDASTTGKIMLRQPTGFWQYRGFALDDVTLFIPAIKVPDFTGQAQMSRVQRTSNGVGTTDDTWSGGANNIANRFDFANANGVNYNQAGFTKGDKISWSSVTRRFTLKAGSRYKGRFTCGLANNASGSYMSTAFVRWDGVNHNLICQGGVVLHAAASLTANPADASFELDCLVDTEVGVAITYSSNRPFTLGAIPAYQTMAYVEIEEVERFVNYTPAPALEVRATKGAGAANDLVNATPNNLITWTEISDNSNSFDPITGIFAVPTGKAGQYAVTLDGSSFSTALAGVANQVIAPMLIFGGTMAGSKQTVVPTNTFAGGNWTFTLDATMRLDEGATLRPALFHSQGAARTSGPMALNIRRIGD